MVTNEVATLVDRRSLHPLATQFPRWDPLPPAPWWAFDTVVPGGLGPTGRGAS
jgi:hypothetical protein